MVMLYAPLRTTPLGNIRSLFFPQRLEKDPRSAVFMQWVSDWSLLVGASGGSGANNDYENLTVD